MDYLILNTDLDIIIRTNQTLQRVLLPLKWFISLVLIIIFIPLSIHAQMGIGTKYKVNSINYEGIDHFSPKELNKNIKLGGTKFFSAKRLTRRMVQTDRLILKTFYLKNGYLNCTVRDSLSIDANLMVDVFFFIEEGEQYKLTTLDIVGNEVLEEDDIKKWLGIDVYDPYNPLEIRTGLKEIKTHYENKGKPFATIKDSLEIDQNDIHLILNINENQTMTIKDISIKNNTKVEEKIIRRELVIESGDIYSKKKIEKSKKYLLNLGLFNAININISAIDTIKNQIDLVVYVREQDMRYWEFNTGLEQVLRQGTEVQTNINFSAIWRHKNILNRAKGLSAKADVGIDPYNFDSRPDLSGNISYMEPWLIGLRSTTLLRLFMDDLKEVEYEYNKFGVETSLIINPDKRNYLKTGFEFSGVSAINQVVELDTAELKQIEKEREKEKERSLIFDYSRDRRNDFLFPSKGHLFTFSGKIATPIFGGLEYYQFETSYAEYFRLYKNIVFAYRGKIGYLAPYGTNKSAPEYEKFYLGGATSMRGWENRNFIIEKSDDGEEVSIKKRLKILTNFELRFPIYWLIGGEVFADGGNLVSDIQSLRSKHYMWNFGVGLTLATPLGPIRVEFAKPLTVDNAKWIPQFAISYAF